MKSNPSFALVRIALILALEQLLYNQKPVVNPSNVDYPPVEPETPASSQELDNLMIELLTLPKELELEPSFRFFFTSLTCSQFFY